MSGTDGAAGDHAGGGEGRKAAPPGRTPAEEPEAGEAAGPAEGGPDDPAPWGLRGALSVPAAAFGGQLLLAALASILVAPVLTLLDPSLSGAPDELARAVVEVSILPVALGSSLFTLGLIYASVRLACGLSFFRALRLGAPTARSAAFGIGGAAVALLYVAMASIFPPPGGEEAGGPLTELARSGPLGHAVWVLLAVAMAPLVEEVLFRGYAYLGARRKMGSAGAGAAVTVVFVLMHVGETGAYWPAMAGIGTLAILLVVIMQRTDNLTHCIACHVGYNGALAVLSFLGG